MIGIIHCYDTIERESSTDSTKYINVIESPLMHFIFKLFVDTNTDVKFQDNVSCHKSSRTIVWFRKDSIELFE